MIHAHAEAARNISSAAAVKLDLNTKPCRADLSALLLYFSGSHAMQDTI